MQTMFVNPSKKSRRRRRKASRKVARRPARRAAPRRVRRRSYRKRRRNAGIAPFVSSSNPMIMPNPRRRTKRRRNPDMKLKAILMNGLMSVGGAGVGAGINVLGIRRIQNVYVRNGMRLGLGIAAGALMQNSFGGATAGALMYPMFSELAIASGLVTVATTTEADIAEVAADLEDVINDIDGNYADDDGGLFE